MSEEESRIESGYDLEYSEDVDLLIFDSASLLVSAGHVEQAYSLCGLIKGAYEKTNLLILLADSKVKADKTKTAASLLREASETSLGALEPWRQSELLCKVAKKTAELGMLPTARSYLERAVEIARIGERSKNAQDQVDSSGVLGDIAEAYSSLGDRNAALSVASSIENEGKRSSVLERLSLSL